MPLKALIYLTAITKDSTPDDEDVTNEAEFFSEGLKNIGYEVEQRPFNRSYEIIKKEIEEVNPSFLVNLVEAVDGKDSLARLAPIIFEKLGIPYTGCTARAFIDTESKVNVKIILKKEGILTPYWLTLGNLERVDLSKRRFLIKSKINHASKDLETTLLEDREEIKDALDSKGGDFFAEEYIEGREFNVSIIGKIGKGKVLPPAEMLFTNWPENKLKIVDYAAKWEENSHGYKNTKRTFNFPKRDLPLIKNICSISEECWDLFELRGYARIDFRVKDNIPYVLEINANPCISPDAGFIAAAHQAGMTDEQVIKNIISDSCGEKFLI
ncbi:MAG: ATP-grasp domain-containing protein [Candidatus Pacearchaeota archaeon]|nr:ATP-grasp domain-containing protein [Candidatus Pacearchaeota archaeon]